MSRSRPKHRAGFTMLTVLWVMSVASVVAMTGMLAGRNAVGAGRNRVEWERAFWRAAGCARRAQAASDEALAASTNLARAAATWRMLGITAAASPLLNGCDVSLEAAGTRLDVNNATLEMFERLLSDLGRGEDAHAIAQELVAARDTQPFAHLRDLSRARGFGDAGPYDSLFSVEPGRVSLATASVGVLLAVPGFTRETAEAVVARRDAGAPIADLSAVLALVSQTSAAALIERYPDAVRMTTPDPDAWILRARWRGGLPATTAELEWRLVRSTRGVAVLRSGSSK